MVAMTSTMNQMLTSDFASVFTVPFMSSKVGASPATTVKSPIHTPNGVHRSGSSDDFQRITSLFQYGHEKCSLSPGCTCETCEANLKVTDVNVDSNGNRCQSPRPGSSPRIHTNVQPRIQPTCSSDSEESLLSRRPSATEIPSPPPGCNNSDGEWVWMTSADWQMLEEFTEASQAASEMLKEQRDALETQAEKSSRGDTTTSSSFTGEEMLLKELQQMRLQLAAAQEERVRLEQHNAELMRNCHFLHSHNMELKQKKAGRPRLNVGSSIFPKRSSPLSTSDTSPAAPDEQ